MHAAIKPIEDRFPSLVLEAAIESESSLSMMRGA